MNVATAIQTVRYQAYEPTAAFWADDEIRQYLWEGECEIARMAECVEVATSITTVTSTQESTYTSTVETIKRVTYDGDRLKKIDFRDLDTLDEDGTASDASTGNPTHYYLWGNNTIGFWPVPTTSAAVKIWGNGTPAQITSSVSAFTVPPQFHNAIPDYALYRMYSKDQDDSRAKLHLDIWEASKTKAVQQWSRRKSADKINLVKDEYAYASTTLGMK
jgi:hypothetical protein